MLTREKAREMADKYNVEREKKAYERAIEFAENEIGKQIEFYANTGENKCTIFIPSHISRKNVIEYLKEHGFEVKGDMYYAEFEISW